MRTKSRENERSGTTVLAFVSVAGSIVDTIVFLKTDGKACGIAVVARKWVAIVLAQCAISRATMGSHSTEMCLSTRVLVCKEGFFFCFP